MAAELASIVGFLFTVLAGWPPWALFASASACIALALWLFKPSSPAAPAPVETDSQRAENLAEFTSALTDGDAVRLLGYLGSPSKVIEPDQPIRFPIKTEYPHYWNAFVRADSIRQYGRVYRELTERLGQGTFPNVRKQLQYDLADAIRRWVAASFRTLETAYPGMGSSGKKEGNIDQLYAAAWNDLTRGNVIDFSGFEEYRQPCYEIADLVKERVDLSRL